ncbi:MAG: VCBS repeat-containing protein, partial [Candidatus Zixiibacteriota bacterium]
MVKALKILSRPVLNGLFLAVIMPVSFPGGVTGVAAQTPDFDIVKSYKADVFGILAVDIDYDNYTDIIYSGILYDSMFISYGKSDGTFETPAFYLNASAAPMVTAFVNADTLLDILVATWTELYVMLNNGDRTFSVTTLPGTDNLGGVATAFFNDDAYLDIVAASDKIHLGNGSGGFPQTITLPFIFKTAYVSDFNNDDIHDLVALEEDGDGAIYLNDGDGNFTQSATFSLGEVTLAVSTSEFIADFNHDGNADFAFVSPIDYSDSSYITIGYGDGTGGLAGMDTLKVLGTSHSLSIADIDRDNNLDIAVSVSYSNSVQNLEVFLGDGSGNYSNAYQFNWGTDHIAHALATGDIDRDGNPDFISGTWAEILPEMHTDSMMIALNLADDEEILPASMTTTGYSNVSLELTNPGGYMISKYCQTVAGSEYWQLDVDGDNYIDERAVDYNMQNGEYKIVIRPRLT